MKLSKLEKPFLLVVLSLITLSLGGMLIMVIFVNRPVAASSWVPHVPKPLQQIIIRSQRMVSGLAQAVVPEALSSLVNDPPPAIDDNIPLPPGSGYDVGFRAKPQGFSFHNYGNREPDGNLTIQEVEALFGKPVCAHQQAGACVPLPEAQLWIDSMNGYMAAGHCAGFTIAAMRLYGQELQAQFFTPDSKVTFDIQQNKPAMGQIAKDWVLQTFPEVAQHQVDGTPRQIIQKLLELGQAVDLGIFNRSGGGHSLLAYGVKDKGNGLYDILVYDNNWPGQDLAIQVDYKANTWRYSIAATNPSEDPKAWEGDAQTQSLIFMPFSAYNKKVACPFCTQTDPAEEKLAIAMSGDQALPEVTTENGQRIGQFGSETINEVTDGELRKIKDAMYNDRAPFLRLPMTTNFNLVMKPRPEFEMATTNLRMMGPGLAFAILNAQIPQGGLAGLQVSPLNQAFAYTPALPNANPIMQIATTRNGVSTIATVAVNGTGSPINLSINPQGGALQIGGVSGNVTLVVATVNANGTTNVFAQANMPVQAGTTVALNVGEWNGTGPMPVSIAQGNGAFVPATPLTNQPLSQVVVALGNGPAIINTLNGISPYLNSNQVNQIVQGLTQINLSGQVLGQIVLGLTLPLSPNQAAALISNLPPVQMAQFFAAAQLSEEMISQIIAAMNLSPTAAAALQTQITRLMELENLLLEIEYNNFQTTGELQAYLEQHGGLTQAELEYIQAELVFNGNSQAILLQPIIAALTPTPEPPTPFPATATPMASGVAPTAIPATVAPSATVPAPTATPESGSSSGGSSGGSDVKTATPTKQSAATPTTTLPTATATAQTGATATPQTGTATPQPGTPTNTPAPSLALGPVGQPLHGKVVLVNNDTGLQYIPEAHFYGSDSFTYTVKGYASTRRLTRQTAPSLDLSLPENTPALDVPIMPNPNANDLVVTVNLSVTNVNDDPLAVTDVVTITENSSVTITILANDTYLPDPPETLAITEMGVPSHGQAVLVAETVHYTPTLHFVGTDSLTYSIADGNGGTATGIISLTVTNINEAPFFVSSPPLMATEDVTYSYLIDANDFDLPFGDSLTLAAITHPTWLTLTNRELSGIPTNEDIGSHNIVLQVTDSTGLTATQAFSIVALNINTPPTFVSTPPLTATQDIAYSYALGATDPDTVYGDFPTFSLIAAPTWLTLNGGVLSGVPTNNDVGLANVVLRVTDMGGLTETQSYTLTIENVNDAPQFVSIPTLYGVQDFTYTYVISTSDIDEIYGDIMQVSLISAPAWLSLTQDPQGISSLTGLPTNSDVGTTTITLQVADSAGLTATQVFSLYIDDLNDLPVNTTPLTQTIQEDNALVLSAATSNQVSVADADIALMPFTVSLTINDGTLSLSQTTGLTFTQGTGLQDATMTFHGEIAAVNAALATLTYSPTLDFNGMAYLTLVSDDRGAAFGGPVNVTNIITVNVMAVNDPPTQTLPSALTMDEDTPTPFAISVADVDASSMQVSLNTVTGSMTLADSSGVTLVNNGAAMTVTGTVADLNRALSNITYHPALNITGTFNLDVTTTDLGFTGSGGELLVNGTIPITINSINDAPINTVPTVMLNMFEDSPLTFSVASGFPIQVEDADSDDAPLEVKFSAYHGTLQLTTTANLTVTIDTQSYFIMTLQGTVTALNQALSVMTYTPKVNFTGPTVLQMSTSDLGNSGSGGVLTDLDDINITVNVNNDTPIFVASPTMLTVENTLETFVYTATALDINPEDTLTFFAPTLPSWLTMTNNGNRTATISGTPAISDTGLHLVELTINDGRLTSLTQAFTITVWNAAPTFVSTPVLSVYQNVTYTYNISTTDIEGNPLTMTATTLPSWLNFLDNGDGTAILSGTPTITNGGTVGAHNTVLEVSDSVSTTQQPFAITVMPPNTVVDILADIDNADSSPGDNSLREAIRYANAGDTITFDPVITGGTITLSSELLIDKDLTISGTVPINISGNNAVRHFYLTVGTIILDGLTLTNGFGNDGSSIWNFGATLAINNSTIQNNTSSAGQPGAINNTVGTLTLNNSTVANNNTPQGAAGGIYNWTVGTMFINNSTIANNNSVGGGVGSGGGVRNWGTMTIKNSTISGNSANTGGGILQTSGTLSVYNTIIANSGSGGDCSGGIGAGNNNLIEDGSCSPTVSGDPQLGPLQNNGGTTMTLAPLPGSPAINAGDNATCLSSDQMGMARPTSGTYWNQCDIGAVEFVRPTKNLLVDITADELEVTNGAGDNSLREAMYYADPGDTITFDAAVSGGTITLGSVLQINQNLTISGTVPITISGNNAVRVFDVAAGVTNVLMDGLNVINGNASGGAALRNGAGSSVTINNSTFANHQSTAGAGAIASFGATLAINNSTFHNNSASGNAGAIDGSGTLTIQNSTFANNSATNNGGAVAFSGPTLTTKNSTFSGNNAANGRTLYMALGAAHIYNTIMANGTGGGSECTGVALTTNTNNLIEDGSCSPALSGDPMLGPLQNNGGTTMSMALLTGSPAANTGNNATCLTTDQRGIARPIGSNCDIGAYETDLAPIAGHFNGLNLDGVDNSILLPSNAALNFNGAANLSVEMWIKTTGTGLMLFGKPGTINGNVQYVFWIDGSGLLQLCMDQQTGAGWNCNAGTTAVNTGVWAHVALTKSGCNIAFYVNGAAAGTATVGGAQCSSTSSTNQASFFAPFFGGYFNGQADEIRLWNVARSQPQIQANMGRTLIGDEAGLLGYWRLEEGSGTTANDATVNGLHGTLQNFVAADWIKSTQTVGPAWRILSTATLNSTLPSYEPDGQSVTYSIVSNGTQGVATITDASTGAFTYVPNPGASGVDTFTYKVNDGTNDSVIQTTTIEFINVVVSTLVDMNDGNYSTGQNSLREAIANAPAGSTITFDASLSGGTITLGGTELQINKSLTISGNVPITINGNNASRVLNLLVGSSTITLENLTLRNGNTDGAAIYNNTNTVTLNNVTVRNNTMAHAAVYNWAGILNINNSTIISNTATGAAGGLYNATGATVNINNSTIASNTSYDGGGIRNFGTMTIQNSTISGNSASNSGGGIAISGGTLTMQNSIVANSPVGGDCVGSITTNLNNLIKDGSCSPALTGDPLLGPLQNNGGATMTMLPSACSPVINAGGATSLTSDQVGNPRVVGAAVDIGAVEHQTAATLLMTVQNNSDTVIAPIGSLREAICAVAVGGTVNFAAGLSGQTITLASELVINKSMTISSNVPIIVSGNNASRVFNLAASATSVTFDGLTIANGNAGAANGGGGIAVSSAANNVTINNSTLTNNTAGYGGAIWNGLGTITINRSTFLTNSATSWEGGAIYNQISGSILTINNSTFYGNSGSGGGSGGGGAIFNNSTATVNNSTFANNSSPNGGGGIYNNGGASLNLKNTIVANSTGSDCANLGTIVTNINNLIQDRTCNVGTTLSGYISGPPNLSPLQNNGGSTLTLAPLANSPALSRGDSGTCLTSDQTGLARPQPITDTTCDIGAVESLLLPPGPGPFAYINAGSNEVYMIDTSVNAVIKMLTVGSNSRGMTISPDGTRVYVTNYNDNTVSVINTSSNTVIATVNVGTNPYGAVVSSDNTRAYIANYNGSGTGTVSVIDTSNNTVVTTITMGGNGSAGIALSPDGTRIYVINYTSNSVSVVDTSNNSVITTFTVGSGPNGVIFSPNGARGYVANINGDTVSVIDTNSNSVVATVNVGAAPRSLAITPDGTRLYVTNANNNNISVIDTGSNTVITTLAVPSGEGIAITPDGRYVYVTDNDTNKVNVIDTNTNTLLTNIVVGTNPFFLGQFITPYPQISSAVVDTVTDNGLTPCTAAANDCSLRGAIARLSAGGTITFDPSLSGQTITLGSALGIYKNMTISSSVPINISGNNNSRVFYIGAGTVTLDSLTIMNGNTGSTTPGGGLFINTGANLTINNNTLMNNTASEGGAIINVGALTINNSTFYNNTSMGNSGGAIYHAGSSLAINNSTIANNSGVTNGGIYSINSMSLKNTLIANNTGNTNADCWNNGGTIAANVNNLIETGNCSGSITTDPNLGALANNGGNTQTMALLAGSPAIDAGNFATCLATDQRGTARGASQCDIGAYEYNTASRPKPATKVYLPIVVRK